MRNVMSKQSLNVMLTLCINTNLLSYPAKVGSDALKVEKIAEEFNVAVYMTNQVIADPGGGVFISDPKKPAGGHVLAHTGCSHDKANVQEGQRQTMHLQGVRCPKSS